MNLHKNSLNSGKEIHFFDTVFLSQASFSDAIFFENVAKVTALLGKLF